MGPWVLLYQHHNVFHFFFLNVRISASWRQCEKSQHLCGVCCCHFSCVRLCATLETAAHQAPLSLEFSRKEYWSGLPVPSPMYEREKGKWSHLVVSDSATPWTAAHQAPPSLGFSRQEDWSGSPVPSPGHKPWENHNSKETCTPMFTAALFTIARTWKYPRCPSTGEWIKKLWYIHTKEYYSAIKKNKSESVVAR